MPLPPVLLALSLAVLAPPQDEVTPGAGTVTLAPGPVAELLERVGNAEPRCPPAAWPAWEDRSEAGWGGEPTWRRWVELLRDESRANDPARRAALVELARRQGRDGDAWAHLLACSSDPGLVAGLLPLFSPGVPPGSAGADALPDGVLLTPSLPPPREPRGGLRWLAGTRIERRDFGVGDARVSLRVSVDRDGLEVALHHLGGGPAHVRVLPPLPRGVDAGLVFADWEKLPGHTGPVEFTLDVESSEHSLWLTFHPPDALWPHPRLETLGPGSTGRAILVQSPDGTEPELRAFAEGLGELLGVPAALRPAGAPVSPGLEPLVLGLDGSPEGTRKWTEMIGLAEAFALSRPLR